MMKDNIKYTYIPQFEESSFLFDHIKVCIDEQIKLHEQKTWELSYIIVGSGTRIVGDRIEPFSRNEIVLIPPNIPHCWSFDSLDTDVDGKIENITIVFSTYFLENCTQLFPELSICVDRILSRSDGISFKGDILMQLQQLLLAMIEQSPINRISSFFRVLELISLAEAGETVGKLVSEEKKTKRMQTILLYIMNNYQNTITLDEMAKLSNLDKSSFCVSFKKMTGKTFFSYLTEYRIEISCQMITKSSMSISEICFASGFKDVPYFNRVFKKIKKCTPTEYRQREGF